MNPALMNKRVYLWHKTDGERTDAKGFSLPQYERLGHSVHAQVRTLSSMRSREFAQAEQIQAEETLVFRMRFRKDMKNSSKVEYQGLMYEVVQIDLLSHDRRYMQVYARRVSDG